ncbi:hypothetical protein OH76DRAFT_806104 [Lentinus brumalis]|uniref:Uncharacterized protein n=1 Tax=Lentinus brumalis TaxID=2498619 RepID=A0A371D2X4_9APHY|nr:hypothetical protein OH76DRAFT_806104 [Polyporus brumalis]
MSRTFDFQDCGAVLNGTIDSNARRGPPIGSLRSLYKYAPFITKLMFKSPTTSSFNSEPVQTLLSQPLPKLRELTLWVEDCFEVPLKSIPADFIVTSALYPELETLSLIGLPINMKSSLSTIRNLLLANYPRGVQPLEWFRLTSILKSALSFNNLKLYDYFGNVKVDRDQQHQERLGLLAALNQHPGNACDDFPTIGSLTVEDTAYRMHCVAEWIHTELPKEVRFIAHHGITGLVNRPSAIDQEALFIDVLAQRQCPNQLPNHLPSPPVLFSTTTDAVLTFGTDSITLKCIGYREFQQDKSLATVELRCAELPRVDRNSRTRLHAMALRSVQWVLLSAANDMRTLRIVGVSDDVPKDAWVGLLNTVVHVPNPSLRELTIESDSAAGHAALELYKALKFYEQEKQLPRGLKVYSASGTTRRMFFETEP